MFSLEELSLAAGVPRHVTEELAAAGSIRFVPGTRFVTRSDAVGAAPHLRVAARHSLPALTEAPLFETRARKIPLREQKVPAFASSFIHAALVGLILWATAAPAGSASESVVDEETHLVFLISPGPGGGGGGGGERDPRPAPRIERRGPQQAKVAVPLVEEKPVITSRRVEEATPVKRAAMPEPKPVEREPDPLPSNRIIAPVATVASSENDRKGVIEDARGKEDSQGPGAGGGAGSGQGPGNGEGQGSGIGDGSGGGTGGGPYRPGSGIEPPRLLREVKAEYTEEARSRGITGDVILEIVVRRDGTVGNVSLLKGLGAGLEQRAMAAVRQWRFTPARRQGQPVDVIVEVAVEFTLR